MTGAAGIIGIPTLSGTDRSAVTVATGISVRQLPNTENLNPALQIISFVFERGQTLDALEMPVKI
ncbi:hypothetical protein GCM10027299_20160 [Larkinella ripae]